MCHTLHSATWDWFISPVGLVEFHEKYWEKKPHIFEHSADYFEDLLPWTDLPQVFENTILEINEAQSTAVELLLFKNKKMVASDYSSIHEAVVDGCSVVINHVQAMHENVFRICKNTATKSGEGGLPHLFCNMYLTPGASQTAPLHADDRDVFVCQLWGEKEWEVYRDPLKLPYRDEQLGKDGLEVVEESLGKPKIAQTLRTGDVLYIPRGFVHQAKTTSKGQPSLHLTFAAKTEDWNPGRVLEELASIRARRSMTLRGVIGPDFVNVEKGSERWKDIEEDFAEVNENMTAKLEFQDFVQAFRAKILHHRSRLLLSPFVKGARRAPSLPSLSTMFSLNPEASLCVKDDHFAVKLDNKIARFKMLPGLIPVFNFLYGSTHGEHIEFSVRELPAEDDLARICCAIHLQRCCLLIRSHDSE